MQKHPSLTARRIEQFKQAQLKPSLIENRAPLAIEYCAVAHPDEQSARQFGPWVAVEPGFKFGPAYKESWFRLTGVIPKEWAGSEVAVLAEIGGERTLWEDNVPARGIDEPHGICRLTDSARGGDKVDLCIQVYSSAPHVVVHGVVGERKDETDTVKSAEIACLNTAMFQLYYDVEFTQSLMLACDEKDPNYAALLRGLNEVCNVFQDGRDTAVARCRKVIKDTLGSITGELKHTITPVGHAHLDTAWLWPLRVTHLKMAHTTATQLYQMERYPEYVFAHSQASQYEWLEQDYPELLKRVKAAHARGQWEPVGSMWVEADCNLTGSESLIRQFLYGRRYFKKHFGVTTDDMWLPDVFGYAAALPQILQKFGIQYFLTQKISWNQFNKFPHNTMWWQGIDGTKVWTHFPPADTYIGNCTPKEIVFSVHNHKDQARSDQSLYLFGWGDGGGGPTEQHLELLRRGRTAAILPDIESGRKAVDFFREAKQKSRDLVTWTGELYLEFHRGTFTSQAFNKKANRYSEFLLRDAEYLCTFRGNIEKTYPAAELEKAWKLVLLNQFHDIIPGSSVSEVYEDSRADYEVVAEIGERIVEESVRQIADSLDTSEMSHPIAMFQNAEMGCQAELPWSETEIPNSLIIGDERHPVQLVDDAAGRRLIFGTPNEALMTVAVGDLSERSPNLRHRLKANPRRLENDHIAVRFDTHGNITSVSFLDDRHAEFIEPGKLANLFQLFDDRPLFWDAWDVDLYTYETARDLVRSDSFEVVERGPVRAAVEIVKTFGKSRIRQRISVGHGAAIRFDTEIDWHEDHQMLKVAFPLNMNATRATYEIQFGHVERPTHQNTQWDLAKFEVPAQKWMDVSEGGMGMALLNNGKYGHDTLGSVMRLSLLRSPKAPDPMCDMGVHRFTYMLMPHYDGFAHADVVAQSYALNAPARVYPVKPKRGDASSLARFVRLESQNLVIESVKKAEDSNRIIVRMYECHNARGSAELSLAAGIRAAWLTDLNESPTSDLEVMDGVITIDYRPFEIITVMLEV